MRTLLTLVVGLTALLWTATPTQAQYYYGYATSPAPGYAPPAPGYGYTPAPTPGYAPPSSGYGYTPTPTPGYAPPSSSGYGYRPAPSPGYAPPAPGYGYTPAPTPGYAPPSSSYGYTPTPARRAMLRRRRVMGTGPCPDAGLWSAIVGLWVHTGADAGLFAHDLKLLCAPGYYGAPGGSYYGSPYYGSSPRTRSSAYGYSYGAPGYGYGAPGYGAPSYGYGYAAPGSGYGSGYGTPSYGVPGYSYGAPGYYAR